MMKMDVYTKQKRTLYFSLPPPFSHMRFVANIHVPRNISLWLKYNAFTPYINYTVHMTAFSVTRIQQFDYSNKSINYTSHV